MISLCFMLFLLIQFNGQAVYGQEGECTVDFGQVVPQSNLPLIVMRHLVEERDPIEAFLPAGKNIQLHYGDKLEVSCPGAGNHLVDQVQPKDTPFEVICNSEDQLTAGGKVLPSIEKLHCHQPISIQFRLEDSTRFLCDDGVAKRLQLLPYVNSISLIVFLCIERDSNTTFHTIKPDYWPKEENEQKKMIPLKLSGEDSNGPVLFVKHLMVPEADLIYFATAVVDKNDLNELTIPMYASISNENMFNVEKAIRNLSLKHGKINVLTLPITIEGRPTKTVLLDNDETEVIIPLIVAKIVEIVFLEEQSEKVFAILVVNRLEQVEEPEKICISRCNKYNLQFDDDGRVLCCDHKDIFKYLTSHQRMQINLMVLNAYKF